MTRFCLNVERVRRKVYEPVEKPLADQVIDALKDRLPHDACGFAVGGDAPGIVICHQGRPFGLHIKQENLSAGQACFFHRLRSSGMRIETARTFNEAMRLIADMGVPLKPEINPLHAARDFFKEETRRK